MESEGFTYWSLTEVQDVTTPLHTDKDLFSPSVLPLPPPVMSSSLPSSTSQNRSVRHLLVLNRGEIALRILQSARELNLYTTALYAANDSTHISLGRPQHAIQIPGPESYSDIEYLIQVIKDNGVDAVHPGYGFLSESAEFAGRVYKETGEEVELLGLGGRS